jgi:hypothetical protein
VAAVVVFGVCLWLAMVVKLPFLPKTERDRWVVAAAFATVMTGLGAVCGGWWAGRENRPESAVSGTGGAGQQIIRSPGSIQAGPGARMKMRDVTIVNPAPVLPGRDETGHPKVSVNTMERLSAVSADPGETPHILTTIIDQLDDELDEHSHWR